MKLKLSAILTICFSLFILVSCNNPKPSEVVNTYFNEIKEGTSSDINNYLDTQIEKTKKNIMQINSDSDLDYDLKYSIENMFKRLEYRILEEDIDGKSAIVKLEIKNSSIGKILSQFFNEGIIPILSSTYTYNTELLQDNLKLLLIDKIDKSVNETRILTVKLTKAKGTWSIEKTDSLFNSILGISE